MCIKTAVLCAVPGIIASASTAQQYPYDVLWTLRVGSYERDSAPVLTGATQGVFAAGHFDEGAPVGRRDIYIAQYDRSGVQLWSAEFGSPDTDEVTAISAGARELYIAGHTRGDLGGPSAGQTDAFIARFDTRGRAEWVRQFGSTERESPLAIASDGAGSVVTGGRTRGDLFAPHAGGVFDAFITKHDARGQVLWSRQIGTPENDEATGVSIDARGDAYVALSTEEAVVILKLDASGRETWSRRLSSFGGNAKTALDPAGNLYVGSITTDSLARPLSGLSDLAIAKLSPAGTSSGSLRLEPTRSTSSAPSTQTSEASSLSSPRRSARRSSTPTS